jgi:hypothetical protein
MNTENTIPSIDSNLGKNSSFVCTRGKVDSCKVKWLEKRWRLRSDMIKEQNDQRIRDNRRTDTGKL